MAEYDVKQLNISKDGNTYHIVPTDDSKADKVANATVNSFAGLDANGNLTKSCLSVVNGKLCITYKKEVAE